MVGGAKNFVPTIFPSWRPFHPFSVINDWSLIVEQRYVSNRQIKNSDVLNIMNDHA